ncbi:hypothetical protein DICPUDRAFT_156854 [Dictyostelium purpureum]|uniref:Calponin-homology (CH) domain-containing protein n=1 Tax=Dictyostelium purpureum TaxID=5786 RepID=F0ZXL7_DICPU|nr:uncharacterized protein DICPUDRAFT_156854 [Dictyostelium purpureum]EGC31320.1 hypothetical protein DICPUDRAFT_156854 [Dictyostelium purpureum]|eukprot:XP_003292164.1 hypothetical protein DICPUDRAFT_156854 [Dictyostelium purpureum]
MNYDENFIQKQRAVKLWIEYILNINLGNNSIFDSLRDGTILCKIMNKFHNRIDFIHYSDIAPLPFKQIENINLFLKKCRLYVPNEYLFNTNDLVNNERTELVLDCLIKLSEYFEIHRMVPVNEEGEFENFLDPIENNNNNLYFNSNNNEQTFTDGNERENYFRQQQQQQEREEQNNSGISSSDNSYRDDENNSTAGEIVYNKNYNIANNNNKRKINKKKLILDCIIEIKYSVIIPLFVSVAAGFGIKMGRTMFVAIESFNYSLFISNSYSFLLGKLTSKLDAIPKFIKYDQIKDYLSNLNLNLSNK